MSQWFNPRWQTLTGYKSWPHSMTNVSILEVNMLKNSSILAASVPINLSIKFGFVSVNDHGETYFMDSLRTIIDINVFVFQCQPTALLRASGST